MVMTSPQPTANIDRNEQAMAVDLSLYLMEAMAPMKAVIHTDPTISCQRTLRMMWNSGPTTMIPAQVPKAAVEVSQAVSSQLDEVDPKT
jgi:hypothetical protein